MALANGLLVHGPAHWAAAVRETDGSITVRSGPKPRFSAGPVTRLPLIRGVVRLAEAMAVLPAVRKGLPQARFAMEERGAPIGIVTALVAGMVVRRNVRSPLAQEAAAAVLGLMPAVISLAGSRAAVWHAVEHKSIAAYEEDGPRGVDNAAAQPKEHIRCGSNLVMPLLVSTAVTNLASRRLLGRAGPVTRAVAAVASAGVAVEWFAFAHRHPSNPLSKAVHASGHLIQAKLATREPDSDDLQVGGAAMRALFAAEGIGD